MFAKFEYKKIPLAQIQLDTRNPRVVTLEPLETQVEIIAYFFEHEDLAGFIKKIAHEGRNVGAERPYLVQEGDGYTVIEGNTRIAAYKLLKKLEEPPTEYSDAVPAISSVLEQSLDEIECSIAPNRDTLRPIMASAHFGLGDKSKWGYLGSRKAIVDELNEGKSVSKIASDFDIKPGEVKDYIIEYKLYLEALKFDWTDEEKKILLNPAVAFNPPVRFLQSKGHLDQVGISYDKANLKVDFANELAKQKFKHLIKKLVVEPTKGLGATAKHDEVFEDFTPLAGLDAGGGTLDGEKESGDDKGGGNGSSGSGGKDGSGGGSGTDPVSGTSEKDGGSPKLKAHALFNYPVKKHNNILTQLMKEAKSINSKSHPAAATFLMRNILECIAKLIIEEQDANKAGKQLSLEIAIDICLGKSVNLPPGDKKILKQLKQLTNLEYMNLGAHGIIIPNQSKLLAIRDIVDDFVRRNV